jgi:hypothetical protein
MRNADELNANKFSTPADCEPGVSSYIVKVEKLTKRTLSEVKGTYANTN